MASPPILCVVTEDLGHRSEVWLWRQIVGINRLAVHVVAWNHLNAEVYGLGAIPLTLVPYPADPMRGRRRWMYRLRNLATRNFYASVRPEYGFLCRTIDQLKPSVILCHFGHQALRLLPVARKLRIPLVGHFHGCDVSVCLENRWYRWSLVHSLPCFSGVVVVGSHQRQWMLEHGVPEEKVHVIPCGVPTREFVVQDRPLDKVVRFLAVSRLSEQKGLKFTIRAFAKVRERIRGCELVIVGDGPLRKTLGELVADLGVSSCVQFTGAVPSHDVRVWMQRSDVFVHHSFSEGWPVAAAEAAACRLPVVAADIPGLRDQIVDGETGFLVPQRNVVEMAEKMQMLALDPALRRDMGLTARRRIEEFDTARQVRKLEDVLLRIAGTS